MAHRAALALRQRGGGSGARRLQRGLATGRQHQSRRLHAGDAMQHQCLASLELEVSEFAGRLHGGGECGVELRRQVLTGNDHHQGIGRCTGQLVERKGLDTGVHNLFGKYERQMLFDRSFRKELAKAFGVTLIVLLTIVLTMGLMKTLSLAAGGRVAPQDVLLMLGFTSIGYLPVMLTLALFIAVVSTLGRQYRDSEMAVWQACGQPLRRFVRPVFGMAWPVLIAVIVLVMLVWPWAMRNRRSCASATRSAATCRVSHPASFKAHATAARCSSSTATRARRWSGAMSSSSASRASANR